MEKAFPIQVMERTQRECIRPGTPLPLDAARRLNSAVGYVTPKDTLAGRRQEIHAHRDRKGVRALISISHPHVASFP
jgi:hypothetical protein